jgi:hypothetical protein
MGRTVNLIDYDWLETSKGTVLGLDRKDTT